MNTKYFLRMSNRVVQEEEILFSSSNVGDTSIISISNARFDEKKHLVCSKSTYNSTDPNKQNFASGNYKINLAKKAGDLNIKLDVLINQVKENPLVLDELIQLNCSGNPRVKPYVELKSSADSRPLPKVRYFTRISISNNRGKWIEIFDLSKRSDGTCLAYRKDLQGYYFFIYNELLKVEVAGSNLKNLQLIVKDAREEKKEEKNGKED